MLSGCGNGGSSGTGIAAGATTGGNNEAEQNDLSVLESQFDAAKAAPITLESAKTVSDFIVKSIAVDNDTAELGLSKVGEGFKSVEAQFYTQLPLFLIAEESSATKLEKLSPSSTDYNDFTCESGSVDIVPRSPSKFDVSFKDCVKYGMTLNGDISVKLHHKGHKVDYKCVKYKSDFTISKDDQSAVVCKGSHVCVVNTDTGYYTKTTSKIEVNGKTFGTKNLVTVIDNTSTPEQISLLFKSGIVYINNMAHWLWISPEKEQIPYVISKEGKVLSGTTNFCNRNNAFIKVEIYSMDLMKISVDINNDGEYEKDKFIVLGDTITRVFFGDKLNNTVVVANVETMSPADPSEVPTGHEITYTADKVYDHPKVYVVNRGSDAMDVMDVNTIELTKTIPLVHHPRSAEQMNKTLRLNETSGMDKPMASIIDIDKDEVVAVVGKNEAVDPEHNPNYGGSHATGHPFWLDAHHFALLDRYSRKVITYYIEKDEKGKWVTRKLSEIPTTTSIHQIVPSKGYYHGEKGIFYGTAEGAPDIYPSIIQWKLDPEKGLQQIGELVLKKECVDVNDMWLHHGDFHPTQPLMYVGSGDGTLFIINYETMKIEKTLQAGKGAGHTYMIPKKDLAIVINHKDVFVTVVDLKTNTKIKDVRVSNLDDLVGKATIQAHPKYYASPDGKYFYAYLTEEGVLYEMSLETFEVTRRLHVGGKPAQGSFVKVKKNAI